MTLLSIDPVKYPALALHLDATADDLWPAYKAKRYPRECHDPADAFGLERAAHHELTELVAEREADALAWLKEASLPGVVGTVNRVLAGAGWDTEPRIELQIRLHKRCGDTIHYTTEAMSAQELALMRPGVWIDAVVYAVRKMVLALTEEREDA